MTFEVTFEVESEELSSGGCARTKKRKNKKVTIPLIDGGYIELESDLMDEVVETKCRVK